MNKTTKIFLGLGGLGIILCLVTAFTGMFILRTTGWALGRAFKTDAGQVAKISSSIADYTLPSGFGSSYALQVAGSSLVGCPGSDNHSHIYLFQLPANVHVDQAEIERQLWQATDNRGNPSQVVGQVPVTIRGQETTLVVSEGVNSDGQPFRQVSGMFQGKGGQALVVFERPVSQWNQAEVDAFLASIN